MERINIAELLKDCPSGMELDCTIFDNLKFDHIDENNGAYNIICCAKTEWGCYNTHTFTEYGCYSTEKYSKCVIFPKGKTTWKGFHRPFEDGDIVSTTHGVWIGIVKKSVNSAYETYITINGESLLYDNPIFCFEKFATEEEKAKLFKAIKDNGYKWNPETKTLEKLVEPKFKVGDRIKLNNCSSIYTITDLFEDKYRATVHSYDLYEIEFERQDAYKLIPNKFDITSLKPFDKVLVRDFDNTPWEIEFFSRLLDGKHFKCFELSYAQCIPYEGNEHLLGKKDDCDKYFKTWK